jgi:hypothetical protein
MTGVQHLTPLPGWHKPSYVGWAPVERFLAGYRKKDWDENSATI